MNSDISTLSKETTDISFGIDSHIHNCLIRPKCHFVASCAEGGFCVFKIFSWLHSSWSDQSVLNPLNNFKMVQLHRFRNVPRSIGIPT